MGLTMSGYIKQFYRGNLFAANASVRTGYKANSLVLPDVSAVKRAVKSLRDYDYADGEGKELVQKVRAFVSTYNNFVDSAKDIDDDNLDRNVLKIKRMAKEQKDELADLGITVLNSGKIKIDKATLSTSTKSKVKKVFGEDADFSSQMDKHMRRIQNLIRRYGLDTPRKAAEKKTEPPTGQNPADNADKQLVEQLMQSLESSKVDYTI